MVHICISSDFSSTYRHACIAAEDFENVRVVDSRNLSTGQGLVVLKACELAKTAASLDELKRELDDFTSRVWKPASSWTGWTIWSGAAAAPPPPHLARTF